MSDAAFARIRELAASPKVVAIGEMGLDYYYDHSPRDVQRAVFAQQLAFARELNLRSLSTAGMHKTIPSGSSKHPACARA